MGPDALIRQVAKNILGEKIIRRMRPLRKKASLAFEDGIKAFFGLLPDRLLLIVKSMSLKKKMDFQGDDIYLNVESTVEYNVRLRSCSKEPATVEWIKTNLQRGDVFYDIGANVGAYSLVAAKSHKDIRVYAFEPGFMTFPQLTRNIVTNKCGQSIVPFQIALSDRTAVDVFNYSTLDSGGALHALGDPVNYMGEILSPVARVPVISYRIDDFIKQFQIPLPNHIKIDVDSIEYMILLGAAETLSSPAVKSILIEVEEGGESADRITNIWQ